MLREKCVAVAKENKEEESEVKFFSFIFGSFFKGNGSNISTAVAKMSMYMCV